MPLNRGNTWRSHGRQDETAIPQTTKLVLASGPQKIASQVGFTSTPRSQDAESPSVFEKFAHWLNRDRSHAQIESTRDTSEPKLGKKRRKHKSKPDSHPDADSHQSRSPSTDFQDLLPQSADDKGVQLRTQTTLDQIELFVQNFFQVKHSKLEESLDLELSKFATPEFKQPLTALLARPDFTLNVITHCLAMSVLTAIEPGCVREKSLLPSDLNFLPYKLYEDRTYAKRRAGHSQLLSRWRVLSVHLRPDALTDEEHLAERDRKIAAAVQAFLQAFKPWVNPDFQDEERARGLTLLYKDAAHLGLFLFAQPPELLFRLPSSKERREGSLIVIPALYRFTDEYGRRLQQDEILVKPLTFEPTHQTAAQDTQGPVRPPSARQMIPRKSLGAI
ncbi:uncharacterized protein KY384_002389 [Bacidia gigantensis]|uniref:uncharacterized protein n=1 Tax=Bacidia gigantensis TaxID=2732470 RepID=UPI001D043ED6|nr:uncharacterized protein KY384_002389 [Bacidia gigantensis]KAG8532512.1 hypothetical protein KY384_002389 [Bacidia gigantensis]